MPKPPSLQAESTLTDRYQTTVPEAIRKALGLHKRDRIQYTLQPNGQVILSRATDDEDHAIGAFLEFLAKDMEKNPQQIQAIDPVWVDQIRELVGASDLDLNATLNDEDE
jgi:antitoxin PrlF